ncbi:MAG: hypothetical protein NTZ19_09335 [Bacteroidetes bacterium]|nr:hypothetical protein [Bacteroidota bacterium]
MSNAKVRLSSKEQELVIKADWILTKNAVIQKLYTFFGQTSEQFQLQIQQNPSLANEAACAIAPKISKGENYEGLPWVMLDYPRYFKGEDVFAIRCFFWWGNEISITLQLAGKFKTFYSNAIQQYFQLRNGNPHPTHEWYIGVNMEDAWQHHFRPENYRRAVEINPALIPQLPFIKMAKKIPLDEWDDIDFFLQQTFKEILHLLTNQ